MERGGLLRPAAFALRAVALRATFGSLRSPSNLLSARLLPHNQCRRAFHSPRHRARYKLSWWRGEDSNLRRRSRQIYSLIPLATREPLHEARHSARLADCCQLIFWGFTQLYSSTFTASEAIINHISIAAPTRQWQQRIVVNH